MAGVESNISQTRLASMWVEAGLQCRSNLILEAGGEIPLHAHSFDHLSVVAYGWFTVKEITPTGETKEYQLASKGYKPRSVEHPFEPCGYRIAIPAGHQHTFTLIEFDGLPGEVLCIWPN